LYDELPHGATARVVLANGSEPPIAVLGGIWMVEWIGGHLPATVTVGSQSWILQQPRVIPLKELLECEPGPAMITYLSCLDLDALDDVSHMIAMELVERQQSWLAELAVRITAKVVGPTPVADPDCAGYDIDDFSAELVGASLGLAPGGARMRVEIARRLTETLPMCRAAMAAGDMSYHHAWVLVDATSELDPVAMAAVDAEVAARVRGQSWPAFRRTLRRALLAGAPDLAEAEHVEALNNRGADVTYLHSNGMGEIRATMSAVDAQTVWLGLDTAAFGLQLAARAV
jgi:hypothetical protein